MAKLFCCLLRKAKAIFANSSCFLVAFSLQVLSRDSVTVSVDAVVYYRVSNPTMATNNIEDYRYSIWIDMYVLMSAPSVHLFLVSFFCPMTLSRWLNSRKFFTLARISRKSAKSLLSQHMFFRWIVLRSDLSPFCLRFEPK